jgi:uncharacterized protein involved in propanediol utilization
MTPPAGPGQRGVLKAHYERVGTGPVAYLDETYHVERDGRPRFYVMAAVVVLESDRDALRNELDEACVIVDQVSLEASDDKDGTRARGAVLGRLMTALHTAEHGNHPPVGLTVIEEHRVARINNYDRAVRANLISSGVDRVCDLFAT